MANPAASRLEGSAADTSAGIIPQRATHLRGITGSAKHDFGCATEDVANTLGIATRTPGTFLQRMLLMAHVLSEKCYLCS